MTLPPTVGRVYYFVRVDRGEVEVARFVRGDAGAAYCAAHCWEMESPTVDVDGWRDILAYLRRQGFAEWSEARAAGLLPANWRPDGEPDGVGKGIEGIAEPIAAADRGHHCGFPSSRAVGPGG